MAARIVSKAALTLIAVLFVAPLCAREIPTPPQFKNVASGVRTHVGTSYHLNPDCSLDGKVIVRLIQKPQNGSVELIAEQGFTNYSKDRQQYKCNRTLTDVEKVFYTSRNGFVGKDRFVIEVFYPNGNYRKKVFNIDVR
jgi:hypothetical protein